MGKGKSRNNLLLMFFCCIIFSLLVSHDESRVFYQKFEINNYYGSLILDILINFFSAFFILKLVSKLSFFEHYHRFLLNNFNKKTGKFISFVVVLMLLFLVFLPINYFIEHHYIVTFLGYHWLFAWLYLLDSFIITETTHHNRSGNKS
ncbi:hypothetical protein [Paenibacillus crassostreae]|uniref:Uncharacterized protein n=1 Tax=Paenibacillus crassostreae TaxID=1763538 RepID=A0A167FCA8_9BACL|nr:hypothetical protein [Paenibacillus crassostreae]AOZ90831.1 hypothetical protein LPB68_00500 [Paenibacillus crassostreae]OAB76404.1 hypothetical protein PNBC_03035 [Paenibacillus crassostreae]